MRLLPVGMREVEGRRGEVKVGRGLFETLSRKDRTEVYIYSLPVTLILITNVYKCLCDVYIHVYTHIIHVISRHIITLLNDLMCRVFYEC